MDIQNKKIWITGASSGIGRAVAIELARRGAIVLLSGRKIERLEAVQREIQAFGEAFILPLDLAETDRAAAHTKTAIELLGGLDMLINNAGISQRSRVAETSLEVDRRIMEVNFFGTVALTKAVLPHFVAQQSGRFVVVSSLVGVFATPMRSAYAASKHALHGFFDALRAEHFNDNIGVTIVCPGFVRTDVSINALTGNGRPQGSMDATTDGGLSPEAFARKMVRAIERERKQVHIGGLETFGIYIKRFLPWLYYRLIRRAKVT